MTLRDELIDAVSKTSGWVDRQDATSAVDTVLAHPAFADHYVTFTKSVYAQGNGWIVEHSVVCRLGGGLATCPFSEAVARVADDDPSILGRWKLIGIDSESQPLLLKRAPAGAP